MNGNELDGLTPKEFYKSRHPEEFSDTTVVRVGALDRDMFSFFLNTLTSKGLENAFEEFCRKLAEREICPNLLPHTGPTGGGDSKVDSETYPVADKLAECWYIGEPAANEDRWAFAISCKEKWKQKFISDVEKIVQVNQKAGRDYKKIFFISSQYISDKKRADAEDNMRSQYGLDIRILDRTWILEKVVGNHYNTLLAIKCFGMSERFMDERVIGPLDSKRESEFNTNEEKLRTADCKASEMVDLSRRNLVLAREMEYPYVQIQGLIARYRDLARKYGNSMDEANAIYDAAHTIFWWYDDAGAFASLYDEYESLALSSHNPEMLKRLATLWINLYRLDADGKLPSVNIGERSNRIQQKYQAYIADSSRPGAALEAEVAFLPVRFFLGEGVDSIIDRSLSILEKAEGQLDLRLDIIYEQVNLQPFIESARSEEFFEKVLQVAALRKEKSARADMLKSRADRLKDAQPYKAIAYYSRTLIAYYNVDYKQIFMYVLLSMARLFYRQGLPWAARNFYVFALSVSLNHYLKFGRVDMTMLDSARALRYIELQQGHMIYALVFDDILKAAQQAYPQALSKEWEKDDLLFETLLGVQIFRTPYASECELERLPDYLERHGHSLANVIARYEFGYYDKDILCDCHEDEMEVDTLLGQWHAQLAMQELSVAPWFGFEPECMLEANVIGCRITVAVHAPYNHGELEIGSTLLAMVESYLGTYLSQKMVSYVGDIAIKLNYDDKQTVFIDLHVSGRKDVLQVTFGNYDQQRLQEQQEEFHSFALKFLACIVPLLLQGNGDLGKIEEMLRDEAVTQRTLSFANSIFCGIEALGIGSFCLETVLADCESLKMRRSAKAEYTDSTSEKYMPEAKTIVAHGNEIEYGKLRHDEVRTLDIININLWNECRWQALAYCVMGPYMLLGLVFDNRKCRYIFEDWRQKLGLEDKDNRIGIRIIKNIDSKYPAWYTVALGEDNWQTNMVGSLVVEQVKSCTMCPRNSTNLDRLERYLATGRDFLLCAAYMESGQPHFMNEIAIQKHVASIRIITTAEVDKDDIITTAALKLNSAL